jgi:hypothetical protein
MVPNGMVPGQNPHKNATNETRREQTRWFPRIKHFDVRLGGEIRKS